MHHLGFFGAIPEAVWPVSGRRGKRSVPHVPCALRLPRGHYGQPHRPGRGPHRLVPLSQARKPAAAHPGAGRAGVHPALPPARPADGGHEGPLLRVPECQLRYSSRAPGGPPQAGLRTDTKHPYGCQAGVSRARARISFTISANHIADVSRRRAQSSCATPALVSHARRGPGAHELPLPLVVFPVVVRGSFGHGQGLVHRLDDVLV
jgi:hypothetical protein